MLERVHSLRAEALAALEQAGELGALEDVVARYVGKRGAIPALLRGLGALAPAERAVAGQAVHGAQHAIEEAASVRRTALEQQAGAALGEVEHLDLGRPAPGLAPWPRTGGTLHPVRQTIRRLENVSLSMGFDLIDGPWAEDDFHNFTALGVLPDHPARDMQDTFWLADGRVLRTHTSPVQIRALKRTEPPIRAMAIGRVFRNEEVDATHENTFHQIEGFLVDREIGVGHMVYVLRHLLSEVLEDDVQVRLRPSYFPFVEPGFEMDVRFRGRWLELLGCGLVHPDVLAHGGFDTQAVSGFAFGLGVDRLAMLRYGIDDVRHFMSGQLGVLRRFDEGVEG